MVSLQGKLDLNSTLKKAEEQFYNYCKRSSWDYLSGLCRTRKSKEDHFLYQLRNLFSWEGLHGIFQETIFLTEIHGKTLCSSGILGIQWEFYSKEGCCFYPQFCTGTRWNPSKQFPQYLILVYKAFIIVPELQQNTNLTNLR